MVAKGTSVASLMRTRIANVKTATITLKIGGRAERREADLQASDANGSKVRTADLHSSHQHGGTTALAA